MQDEKPDSVDDIGNDEILEDDLDLGVDDLAEESWDEFDDEESIGDLDPQDAVAPRPKKKSSLPALMIIGLVILGGGYLFTQMGGSSTPAPEAPSLPIENENPFSDMSSDIDGAEMDVTDLSSDSDLPPMPAPMETSSEELPVLTDNILIDEVENFDAALEDETLTPMPDLQDSEETIELVELDIEPVKAEPPQKEAEELLPNDFMETPEPAPEAAEQVAVPVTGNVVPSEDLEAIKNQLSELQNLLLKKTQSTDNRVEALAQSVAKIEKDMEELAKIKSAPAPAKEPAKEKAPEPILKDKPKPSKPVAPPVAKPAAPAMLTPMPGEKVEAPAMPKTSAGKDSSLWQLRSAQPGKAVLAAKDGGDLKTVEVGSNVKGLGKITSISVENGRWVVRGTQGQVSR